MTTTSDHVQPASVSFTKMADGTRAEYQYLHELEHEYIAALPDRLTAALRRLGDGLAGYQVSRLEHSLQSASRAELDGADVDMIVGALLHDLGDELAPENHSQVAAAIVRPYVRAEVTWVIEMHGLFQMVYYGEHLDLDPNGRDVYRDHPWYESCVNFCERWDQTAFDPAYPSKPIEYFEPMLREVFGRKPFDPSTGCL